MKNLTLKHWLIKKLLKWSKILDIEKALRDKYHEGCAATEKKYANRVNVWFDPTVCVDPHFHVQPAPTKPAPVVPNPRGRYFKAHHLEFMPKQEVVRTNTEPIDPTTDFPPWLNSAISIEHMTPAEIERVDTKRDLRETPPLKDLLDAEHTEEMPAVVALLHQDREQRRHAG